ncbi:HNH endonuclease [Candidatus Saccharibacteria bacterium]|nr:HNH endonuclease [Candidatus Saccharibacteria bacterium]
MKMSHRMRRTVAGAVFLAGVGAWLIINPASYETEVTSVEVADEGAGGERGSAEGAGSSVDANSNSPLATEVLEKLEVKGRAPKTGYARTEFYNNWPDVDGCSLRQRIIKREVGDSAVLEGCNVVAGHFIEPYTGEERNYTTREEFSKNIQIDHIVALSDAWQKGAQYMEKDVRYQIATDPLNLIAADGPANMQKSDGDAATWLPPNKKFRCEYVARQVAVKYKYHLWVTEAEKDAMNNVLSTCPNQKTY